MDLELLERVALVTGGSKGIGKAIALALAREGADIAICARQEEPLEAAAGDIRNQTGRKVLPIVADVSRTDEVERLVQATVAAFGRLDILINNAGKPGGLATGPLPTVRDELMLEDLNVKFLGYLRCARAAAPHMQSQGWGRIINVGGLSARQPGAYSTGARNIAIVHMSKTLAEELGPFGITVNVVHPGSTRTEYLDQMLAARAQERGTTVEEIEREMAQGNPIRRIVDAQDVAWVVAFLASPKAGAITGEVISAGGGAGRAVLP
ncbi:MAG: SDR family oxidoreductase [Chloroflexi bacterium]|nr:SDR family oxidoreductase [Chloroflexota bacterium]